MSDSIRDMIEANNALGMWMSAAISDPRVCAEMRSVIVKWFVACAKLEAAQAQAGEGESPVAVADKGVINLLDGKQFDHEVDLYTQPAQVNQQLLYLLKQAASYTRHNDYDWDLGFIRDVDTAIAAAQEQGK